VFRKDRLSLVTTMVAAAIATGCAARTDPTAPSAPAAQSSSSSNQVDGGQSGLVCGPSGPSTATPGTLPPAPGGGRTGGAGELGSGDTVTNRERRRPEHRRPEAASSVLVPVGSDIHGQRLRVDAIDGHPAKRVASAWQSTPRARRRPRVLGRVHTDFVR